MQAQQKTDSQLLATFRHKPAAEQERVHDELLSILDGVAGAHEQALRAMADRARAPHPERQARLAARHGKRVVGGGEAAETCMPITVQYVFGVGAIDAIDAKAVVAHKPGKAAEQPSPMEKTPSQRAAAVAQALLGIAPGADFALAELLAQLDSDTGGDRFAAFLHSWRNGSESFYEALDRTSGTKDSVFFYDSMLGDFRSEFAAKDAPDAERLKKSLQAAHDALHDAFLAYRQYRGFREAIAWSLVLPPDARLPKRLARYEVRAAEGYSLRQQVTMVLALHGDDPHKVVAEIVRTSPALGQPLWQHSHDPHPPWNDLFTTLLPKMIEQAQNSDAFLATAEQARRDAATVITAAARKAIDPEDGGPPQP